MILIVLTIIAAFLQSVIGFVNLPLIFLALGLFNENLNKWFITAFASGLLVDLVLTGTLGFNSIFNLLFVFIVSVFKLRFAYNFRWAILFIILSQIIWFYVGRFNF